jgi:plasmid stability protein
VSDGWAQAMPDLLINDIDSELYERLKQRAEAQHKSLEQFVREALAEKSKSKEEIWAEIDRIRERIGPVSSDSTADIREHRDNDEPYR